MRKRLLDMQKIVKGGGDMRLFLSREDYFEMKENKITNNPPPLSLIFVFMLILG